MAYTPTIWGNGKAPAINGDNLNKIEQGIVDVDRATTQNTADIASANTAIAQNASDIATANTAIAQNTADIKTLKNQSNSGSGGGGASTADCVSYDNTDSGLTATNAQDAIDELDATTAKNASDIATANTAIAQNTADIQNLKKQGGGGSNDVELTLAEYEALGDVVNSDNVNYFITDSNGSGGEIGGLGSIEEIKNALTLDFSGASSEVQDLRTFLQKALEKLFPLATEYIYKMGNALTSAYAIFAHGSQTATNTEKGYYFKCASNTNYALFLHSQDKIDFTNINKIVVEVDVTTLYSSTSDDGIYLGISDNNAYNLTYVKYENAKQTGDYKIELDLSEITGSYYFKLCVASTNNEGYIKNVYYV